MKPSIEETVKHFDGVWPTSLTTEAVIAWAPESERFAVWLALGTKPEDRICTYSEFMAASQQAA